MRCELAILLLILYDPDVLESVARSSSSHPFYLTCISPPL